VILFVAVDVGAAVSEAAAVLAAALAGRAHPHVTLGRVRDGRGLDPRRLFSGFEHERLGRAAIDAITLFESRRGPGEPAYVAVQTSQLTGRTAGS